MNEESVMCMCVQNKMLFSHKKLEILLFATIWVNLQGIMLSQRMTNNARSHLYVKSRKLKSKTLLPP